MNEDYVNYFHAEYLDASESKISTLVNKIERKSLYPIYLKFHLSCITDNEKSIKSLEKEANFKKNAAIKEQMLKLAAPYRNTVKKQKIAVRLIKSLM